MSAAPQTPDAPVRLLDLLLDEQRALAPVEVFADRHDEGAIPSQSKLYEELIPLGETPGPGQQLAFRVDLDSCTGCKACVTACHSLNGLDTDETWRDVGLLLGATEAGPVQQTVTTACHHCEDPGCLNGCPVKAYDKDPVTGIVRHLDDQCIGCQYCVLKCPYDVPKYNAELGIVRKCDMCAGRLAEGEAPACVQGCPNSAIAIEIVDQVGADGAVALLPLAQAELPDSRLTRPTTRYVSQRPHAALRAADSGRTAPGAAHDPLAIMLVLLQLSVGLVALDALLGATGRLPRLALAAAAGAAGLGAATLHLGRPLYAFRAFLGWRTSWMSREILTFGAYVPCLFACLGLVAAAAAGFELPDVLGPALFVTLAAGLVGTLCSVMIYVDTGRAFWALPLTATRFAGSLVALGAMAAALAALTVGSTAAAGLVSLSLGAVAAKLAWEVWRLRGRRGDALARSRALLTGALWPRVKLRWAGAALGIAAGAASVALPVPMPFAAGLCALALFALMSAELGERRLFFVAEASRGMPGA